MKIIHISDLHFGMHHEHLIELFLNDLSVIQPDIVLISGDLTQRAKSYQYKQLLLFLDKISAQIFIVPGNHDIPLWNPFARLFNPFKKYNFYIKPNFKTKFNNDSVRILGVNSVNPYKIKDGILSFKTMSHIEAYFKQPFDGLNILFFHHNFGYMIGSHKPLQNHRQFLNYLKQSPIHIVCTGHLHYANTILIEKNDHRPCLLLHAGSLLCTRSRDGLNSYYLMEATGQKCRIDWRVLENKEFNTLKTHEIDFSKKSVTLKSAMYPFHEK